MPDFNAKNAPKSISAYSAPPDPLAGFGGPILLRRGEGKVWEGRGREEREGEGKGKERAMRPPLFGGSLRLCWQALNCLSIYATYCVIVAGASPEETKMWAAVCENGDFLHLQFE